MAGANKLSDTQLAKSMTELGFKIRKDCNQWSTFVSFERGDLYANVYNKPIQRFEADLVTTKIGNGI